MTGRTLHLVSPLPAQQNTLGFRSAPDRGGWLQYIRSTLEPGARSGARAPENRSGPGALRSAPERSGPAGAVRATPHDPEHF